MQSYKEKYGQWALVLGATEGIGRAGAIELAHPGMDIILVGRREDKLHELAEFIKSDSGHGAMVMEYDLASRIPRAACCSTPQTWRSAWCAMWPANAAEGPFVQTPYADFEDMLQVNVRSFTRLLHHFAGLFCQRGRGAFVTIGALAGWDRSAQLLRLRRP